jgi:DNA-binding CsgD family transcriptional regulator
MKKLEFQSQAEELRFFKTILEKLPALMGVQQFDDFSDPTTNHNIWSNQNIIDFIGYSREEMDELGYRLFLQTIHPEDMEMIGRAMAKFDGGPGAIYGGVYRLKPKDKDYKWVIGAITVMEMRNGLPWRFLNVTLDIDHMKDTQNQIIALTKENNRLKNQIKLDALTKREKEIIRHIALGNTDKEIGKKLFISHKTAKTHRNNIHRKLDVSNSAAIVHFALENGLS